MKNKLKQHQAEWNRIGRIVKKKCKKGKIAKIFTRIWWGGLTVERAERLIRKIIAQELDELKLDEKLMVCNNWIEKAQERIIGGSK